MKFSYVRIKHNLDPDILIGTIRSKQTVPISPIDLSSATVLAILTEVVIAEEGLILMPHCWDTPVEDFNITLRYQDILISGKQILVPNAFLYVPTEGRLYLTSSTNRTPQTPQTCFLDGEYWVFKQGHKVQSYSGFEHCLSETIGRIPYDRPIRMIDQNGESRLIYEAGARISVIDMKGLENFRFSNHYL